MHYPPHPDLPGCPRPSRGLAGIAVLSLVAGGVAAAGPDELPDEVMFNRDIRPILSDKCFHCHGFDANSRKAGLRLDTPEGAYAAFDGAFTSHPVVPGDRDGSEVWQRVRADDPGDIMPPPDYNKPLSQREIDLIGRWIDQGAGYQEHWSFSAIERPEVPTTRHAELVRTPVDAFIFSRLEAAGLEPLEAADRASLLRRLTLDLTGLPPTPDELAEFLADPAPGATGRVIDRLLGSPHYGERMAVPWLDAVRYADTVGYHGDQNARIFPYRDYVIRAFNDNLAFDRFTREQVAGDLLEGAGPEQLVATGFLRLNLMTREGGAQPEEYMAKYASDRVRAIGAAWLGLTTGCAECHDHKFDPFTIDDFYAMAAFFDDIQQWGVYSDYGYTPNPDLRGWNNDYPFPPELVVASDSLRRRIDIARDEGLRVLARAQPVGEDERAGLERWLDSTREFLDRHPEGWVALRPEEVTSLKDTPHELRGEIVVFGGAPRPDDEITLRFTLPDIGLRTLRLEVLPDDSNGGMVGRSGDGRFTLTPAFAIGGEPVEIEYRQADRRSPHRYSDGHPDPLLEDEWRSAPARLELPSDAATLPHHALYHLKATRRDVAGRTLTLVVRSADVGAVRVSASPIPDPVPGFERAQSEELVEALAVEPGQWQPELRAHVEGSYRLANTANGDLAAGYRALRQTVLEGRAGLAHTMVVQRAAEGARRVTRVLPRGDWMNPGEPIAPGLPGFLAGSRAEGGGAMGRRELAEWLVDPDNPLVARHFVNRLWRQFFGSGLSNVLDDLGNQGEWPSHPELLDWLAAEFQSSGWDVKHMVRLMVSSYVYQQAVADSGGIAAVDPDNRLLAGQSPRRLDAEFIRDNALAAAGLLRTDVIGGPSVKPLQPAGYYANLNFPQRDYRASDDFDRHRRGVYTHWQRTFLHPMLAGFDAPSRDECAADRMLSNSPQQALILLNDPSFVEAAGALVDTIFSALPEGGDEERIGLAFRRVLAREADAGEVASLLEFLAVQRELQGGDDPKAAWRQLARVLFNLHESITRY